MKSRFLFAAIASVALVTGAGAAVLVNTGFDSTDSPAFATGNLDGQNGWLTADFTNFVVGTTPVHGGNHSVGIGTSLITADAAWVPFTPVTSGIVITTAWVRYDDSTPGDRTDNSAFGLEAWWNDGTERVGTLMLDARGGATIMAGFDAAPVYNSSISTPANTWHKVVLACKPGSPSTIMGWVNGTPVGAVQTNLTAGVNSVSDVDLTAYAYGDFAGNFGVATAPLGGLNNGFFDSVMVETVPTGSIGGHVNLNDWSASASGVPVVIEIINGGGSTVETVNSTLNGTSDYTVSVAARGTFSIGVKASHWLRKVTSGHSITDFGLFGISHTLVNGDVDNDNEVGPGDFGALSSAFGSVDGDSNWDAMADLDGDGEVGPSDFGILSANFGESGD